MRDVDQRSQERSTGPVEVVYVRLSLRADFHEAGTRL
jgi:hypothetical protein